MQAKKRRVHEISTFLPTSPPLTHPYASDAYTRARNTLRTRIGDGEILYTLYVLTYAWYVQMGTLVGLSLDSFSVDLELGATFLILAQLLLDLLLRCSEL